MRSGNRDATPWMNLENLGTASTRWLDTSSRTHSGGSCPSCLRKGVVDADVHAPPVVAGPPHPVQVVLPDHGELRVQRDAHARVRGQLEGGAVVEGAAHGLVAVLEHRVLDLAGQPLVLGDGLGRLLALLARLLEHGRGQQVAAQEGVDVLLLEREARLDRLLARPVLPVRLALDEDGLALHAAVPAQADGLGALRLLQAALVQLPGGRVVVVDRRDGRVLGLELLARVEHQDRQVLEDDQLELGHVVRVHPVLRRLADEAALAAAGGAVALDRVPSRPHEVVQLGELDHGRVVVLLVERLRLEPGFEDGFQLPSRHFLSEGRASQSKWDRDEEKNP
ncbi:hypothetical protein VTK73DRAFT_5773 [Phialemonium thermophilum]|uniref:Uncharacterized protein n=1 Tax=Phialemonium thermophilum TaxID=223376 RepID=A0ABR3V229_9PEZI